MNQDLQSREGRLDEDAASDMKIRRITLPDGRYMIFYTFNETPAASSPSTEEKQSEPHAKPEAAGERYL
jgi:hypothetical protein